MLGMLTFAVLLLLGWQQDVTQDLLAPITEWNAQLAAALLHLQGIEVLRQGASLHHTSGFSCTVDLACTGLPLAALILVAVALYPTTTRFRVRALAIGLPLLLVVNLVRMIHLVRVGIETPESFDFVHDVAWRVGLLVLFAVSWTLWRHLARIPRITSPQGV